MPNPEEPADPLWRRGPFNPVFEARSNHRYDTADYERIDPALQAFVDSGEVSGIYAVIARHGHIRYERTFGRMDLARDRPMRPDAIFRIASQTKALVSTAILMLQEEGRLREQKRMAGTYHDLVCFGLLRQEWQTSELP